MITDKKEIIKQAELYLKEDSWLDMNGFIWNDVHYPDAPTSFIFDVANRMQRTGKYQIQEQKNTGRWLIIPLPKKSFKERYVFIVAILTCGLGVFSPIIEKSIEQKIWPAPTQSKQTIQAPADTSVNRNK